MSRYVYYGTTGLFALAMTGSGAFNLSQQPAVLEGMAHLGFPAWLPVLLGAWKLLGVGAILAPGLPRLKEWAYAGFFFNLTGATVAHVTAGDPVGNAAGPLIFAGLALASWATRPADRRLGDVLPGANRAAA